MHQQLEVGLPRVNSVLSIAVTVSVAAGATQAAVAPLSTDSVNARVAAADSVLEVPLVYTDGRLLVPMEVASVGTRWFILDTAAGRSVISQRLRDQLTLTSDAVRRDTVQGATGPVELEFVRLPGVRLAGREHEDAWVVVSGITDFREYDGLMVDGILGVELLRSYDVAIDVAADVMRLYPQDGSAIQTVEGRSVSVPFHSSLQDGFVQFAAAIAGEPVEVILDTGARDGTLNWHAADLAGITPESPGIRANARGAGGMSGERVSASSHVIDEVCLADSVCLVQREWRIVDLPVFRVAGTADGPAALVGADLMQTCPVLIAYSTATLHLCEDMTR